MLTLNQRHVGSIPTLPATDDMSSKMVYYGRMSKKTDLTMPR